tara:strand:- start:497918 stop:498781 length:864 start_codon:yes stop_codon:yes gene_type:complete
MTTLDITEPSTSKFAQIREGELNMQVHYNDIGDGAETVVMLHGSGPGASGWANFQRNIEPLVNANFRVLLMDSPGWSKSDPVVCNSSRSDLNAIALKGLLDTIGVQRVHILGNSMGAHSAVAFALHYPERVGKLVLMGGGTGGAGVFTPMPTEGIRRLNKLYCDPTIENLKEMMDIFVYDTSDLTDSLFETRLENMLACRQHLENYTKSLEANPNQFPDYSSRLGEINADTLVIWGLQDRFVPMDYGLRLVAGLTNSELHIYNRCGHWVQWEHSVKFNRMVLNFLSH